MTQDEITQTAQVLSDLYAAREGARRSIAECRAQAIDILAAVERVHARATRALFSSEPVIIERRQP